jgi:voltage-gated potassium channel
MVLPVASILVLQQESRSADANIRTGGNALWWAIVTITTVGYGDYYPVTTLGRLTAVFVMFSGIGIIGALASILASLLVAPPSSPEPEPEPATAVEPAIEAAVAAVTAPIQVPADAIAHELAGLRAEIAALRASLGSAG